MTASDKKLRKDLRNLCDAAALALARIDAAMVGTLVDRPTAVAAAVTDLEMAHDIARHFGLGESFAKIKLWKSAAEKQLGLVRAPEVLDER